jgi:phosphatidylglycerophosphate synthase
VLFWSISILFDFCDGTVARMTNQVRKTAFRYDHNSDLFKIFIVILGVAIIFDDVILWSASISASFFFMFYSVLNSYLNLARSAPMTECKDDGTSM